jgi:hypothetical protein
MTCTFGIFNYIWEESSCVGIEIAAQFVMDSMMLTDVPLLFLLGQDGTFCGTLIIISVVTCVLTCV